jgi:hypothetical protein
MPSQESNTLTLLVLICKIASAAHVSAVCALHCYYMSVQVELRQQHRLSCCTSHAGARSCCAGKSAAAYDMLSASPVLCPSLLMSVLSCMQVCSAGLSTYLPGRRSAGSSASGLLVAPMSTTLPLLSRPSMRASRVDTMLLCTWSCLLVRTFTHTAGTHHPGLRNWGAAVDSTTLQLVPMSPRLPQADLGPCQATTVLYKRGPGVAAAL